MNVLKYITRTGRALGQGRTYRSSHLVRTRCRGQEQPLPINLQCHPMALTRTPVHPKCYTSQVWRGRARAMMRDWTRAQMMGGIGLQHVATVGIDYGVTVNGRCKGFAAPMEALAWVRAAHSFNIDAECSR